MLPASLQLPQGTKACIEPLKIKSMLFLAWVSQRDMEQSLCWLSSGASAFGICTEEENSSSLTNRIYIPSSKCALGILDALKILLQEVFNALIPKEMFSLWYCAQIRY